MKQVLFIHGGGDDGYKADALMVHSLQERLGEKYKVIYEEIPSDESLPDFGWPLRIGEQIAAVQETPVIVAHSLGASMLLKYLSESSVSLSAAGIFLIATPFWTGGEEWKRGLKLHEDFACNLPDNSKFFFYHAKDDTEVPFEHFQYYKRNLPSATFCEMETGGHQLGKNIDVVAKDIIQNVQQREH